MSEPAKVGRIDDNGLVPFVPESRDTDRLRMDRFGAARVAGKTAAPRVSAGPRAEGRVGGAARH